MKKISLFLIIALIVGVVIYNKNNQSTESHSTKSRVTETTKQTVFHSIAETPPIDPIKSELDGRLKELPTMGDLRDLSEEDVHFTPTMIKEGGRMLGRIHAEADSDPTRRPQSLAFFKECAEDNEIAVAIRAVCWNKLMILIPQWELFISLSDADVSEEVKSLASELP